jgi:hypothetical protein
MITTHILEAVTDEDFGLVCYEPILRSTATTEIVGVDQGILRKGEA